MRRRSHTRGTSGPRGEFDGLQQKKNKKNNNNTGCETAWGRRMGVSRLTPRHFYLIFFFTVIENVLFQRHEIDDFS